MDTLIYIVKATAVLSLFFLAYELLLKRETFFKLNRIYLLVGIGVAAILPLITFVETIIVEPVKNIADNAAVAIPDSAESVALGERTAINEPSFWANLDYTQILLYLYFMGVIFFVGRFIFQFIKLQKILRYQPKSYRENGIRFIETNRKTNPFSFFKTVVFNPELHSEEELHLILKHEKAHIQNWHSLDLLLANGVVFLNWFNPLAWFYRKRIDQNLEFLADWETTHNLPSKKAYQLSLLRFATGNTVHLPVNQFHSFTKTRIKMLHRKKSATWHYLKLGIVLPFLLIFLFGFQVKTVEKVKTAKNAPAPASKSTSKQPIYDSIFNHGKRSDKLIINGKKKSIEALAGNVFKVHSVSINSQGMGVFQAEKLSKKAIREKLFFNHTSKPTHYILFDNIKDGKIMIVGKSKKGLEVKTYILNADKEYEKIPVQQHNSTDFKIPVKADYSTQKLQKIKEKFAKTLDCTLTFSEIKRNTAGRMTHLKLNVIYKDQKKETVFEGDDGITPFSIGLVAGKISIEIGDLRFPFKTKIDLSAVKFENIYWGITDSTTDKELQEIKNILLRKKGVKVDYYSKERNTDGLITQLGIRLSGEDYFPTSSITNSPNGIPEMRIGVSNGKLDILTLDKLDILMLPKNHIKRLKARKKRKVLRDSIRKKRSAMQNRVKGKRENVQTERKKLKEKRKTLRDSIRQKHTSGSDQPAGRN